MSQGHRRQRSRLLGDPAGVTEGWAGTVTTGAPATIEMLSGDKAPPQDLHFNVSRLTSPGRSIFRVTCSELETGAGLLRPAIQINPKPMATEIRPIKIHPLEPSGLNAPQINNTPKRIRIAAPI